MVAHWVRLAALSCAAVLGSGAVSQAQREEPAAGTPPTAATPVVVDQGAFPVRAGDSLIVIEEHVILQPEPAYSSARVAMLPQFQVMEATGRAVVRDGERWLELRYPVTGAVGWVSDRWLTPLPVAPQGTPRPSGDADAGE